MIRAGSVALGIGLIILWLCGLSVQATAWLTWLDGLGGLVALLFGGIITPDVGRVFRAGAPIGIAVALYILWIIGLLASARPWLTWWTFAFASAFLILGLVGGVTETTPNIRTNYPRTV